MKFSVRTTDGSARAGVAVTDHGEFETPAFMPVGTQGTVKSMTPADLLGTGAQIILSNTYHLYLRPGLDVLRNAGGLHRFMNWPSSLLTDSGGYQVFSLVELRTIAEEGVRFKSHLDGSSHTFTPESVVDIQRVIGSDIMMVLDECPPYPCTEEYARASGEMTIRWARRCKERLLSTKPEYGHEQAQFVIAQGSVFPELRERSMNALLELDPEGIAIGGLAVGEPASQMYEMVSLCASLAPAGRPRYLMGVGLPENLLEAIDRGVDMFDCVLPTRNGRNAMLFTRNGSLTITNAKYKNDQQPIDGACGCYACRNFSRSYLRHLFTVNELLGLHLATVHNLFFYQELIGSARKAILEHRFSAFKQDQLRMLAGEVPAGA